MFVMFALADVYLDQECQLHVFIIYSLIVGMLVVVGIIGNSLDIAVFWRGNFNSSTSFLFMCLALTDSVVLLTAFLAFSLQPWLSYTGYMEHFWDGYARHELLIFVVITYCCAHTATMWMTVLIAINRYILVCRPLRASQWCTNSKVKKQLAVVLGSAVLYTIAVSIASQLFAYLFIFISVMHAILLLILPICILTLLNIRLIKALINHRRMQTQNQSIQKDNSTTFVLVIVIVVVITCQLPQLSNVGLLLLAPMDACDSYGFYLHGIFTTLVVLNSAVNCIIYIVCNKRFRAVLMEKVFKRPAPQQVAIAHEVAGVERANCEPGHATRL